MAGIDEFRADVSSCTKVRLYHGQGQGKVKDSQSQGDDGEASGVELSEIAHPSRPI
jgi:hypothetical protein